MREELTSIFRLYYNKFYYVARDIVKNNVEAEDIVSECFASLCSKINEFKDTDGIRAFLHVAVTNRSIDYLKRKKKEKRGEAYLLINSETNTDYIESKMIKAELYHKILKESQSLIPARSKIFRMIFLEELTVSEVSDLLGISTDNVRVLKMQALNDIKYSLRMKEKPLKERKPVDAKGDPVIMIKNGEIVETFPSVIEAESNTKISKHAIKQCLRNKSKTAGGYGWKYQTINQSHIKSEAAK